MFGLGAGELLIILVFALLFIGPKKLPELARGLGKGLREFQKAKDDLMTQIDDDADQEKTPTGVTLSEPTTDAALSTDAAAAPQDEKTEDQTTQEKPKENA